MEDGIAIRVKGVKKNFRLPHHRNNSLKGAVTQVFKKKDKRVDTHHALRGISFDIKKGEFFGILGRNGTGKSTLLKILAEIYQPTKGSVAVRGKLVPFIELGVGFNSELSGRENVYLNGALLGFSKKEIEQRYEKIVEFAELKEFMDQKLKNYSSGMKVRLAFSVAIQADADILLLDEVLAVGDASFQRKCYDYFKSLKLNKKTIVFVSHNMNAVREYCDRAILIEDGKVSRIGDANEVADEYLKLFNSPKHNKNSKRGARWGNMQVVFDDVEVAVNKDSIKIKLVIKNNDKAVSGLDIGVDFYNDNKVLVGGNQYIHKYPKGFSVSDGERKTIEFEYDNVFGRKDFYLSINIKSADGGQVFDFWKDAISFSNNYQENDFFPIILNPRIKE